MTDVIYPIILMIIAMVLLVSRRSKGAEGNFDERQLMIRGKAYKYGFIATLAALTAVMLCNSVFQFDMMLLGAGACLFTGLTVFAVYCIWNDAFLSFRQKPSSYLFSGGIVIICNGAGIVKRLAEGTGLYEMLSDVFCLNMLCAAAFVVIEATIVIKLIATRREQE